MLNILNAALHLTQRAVDQFSILIWPHLEQNWEVWNKWLSKRSNSCVSVWILEDLEVWDCDSPPKGTFFTYILQNVPKRDIKGLFVKFLPE